MEIFYDTACHDKIFHKKLTKIKTLSNICIEYIHNDIKSYEQLIGDSVLLTKLFVKYQQHKINNCNYGCELFTTQIIYKKAYLYDLIAFEQLIRYAFLYNIINGCKLEHNLCHNYFNFDEIIDYIPIDKLKYIFLHFPSTKIVNKFIYSSYNKLLLSVVRFLFYEREFYNILDILNKYDCNIDCRYNMRQYQQNIREKYYDVVTYLLKINRDHFINNTTHLLSFNVNDTYDMGDDENINTDWSIPGRNIFHFTNNNITLLTILLNYCGDNKILINHKDANNDTPFYLACCADKYVRNEKCVKLFLTYGSNLFDTDNCGNGVFNKLSPWTWNSLVSCNMI